MTTASRIHEGLGTTRFVLSLFAIIACTAGLASAQDPPPPPPDPPDPSQPPDPKTMCLYADWPEIGPCDIDQGYEWPPGSKICYFDDGCYITLENCCPR